MGVHVLLRFFFSFFVVSIPPHSVVPGLPSLGGDSAFHAVSQEVIDAQRLYDMLTCNCKNTWHGRSVGHWHDADHFHAECTISISLETAPINQREKKRAFRSMR